MMALLGAWIAAVFALMASALTIYQIQNTILDSREPLVISVVNAMPLEGQAPMANLLRHMAGSVIRLQYQFGEVVQTMVAVSVLMLYLATHRLKRSRLGLIIFLFVLVMAQFFLLRPKLDRALLTWEVASPSQTAVAVEKTELAGAVYGLTELTKLGVLLFLGFRTMLGGQGDIERRRRSRSKKGLSKSMVLYRPNGGATEPVQPPSA